MRGNDHRPPGSLDVSVAWEVLVTDEVLPASFGVNLCPGDSALAPIVEAIVGESEQDEPPGACVGILMSTGGGKFNLRTAAAGERQRGLGNQVTDYDVWHIGSCCKAMTATLAAVLIESGDFPGFNFTMAQLKECCSHPCP